MSCGLLEKTHPTKLAVGWCVIRPRERMSRSRAFVGGGWTDGETLRAETDSGVRSEDLKETGKGGVWKELRFEN